MDEAELHLRPGENGFDGLGKAFEPIDTGDKNILHAAILALGDDLEPEFGPLGLGDPHTEEFFLPLHCHAQHQVDGFIAHMAIVAHFDHQRI